MNSRDLKPAAQRVWLKTILTKLNEQDLNELADQDVEDILSGLALELDNLDQDDFFGTEGWRHSFGLED